VRVVPLAVFSGLKLEYLLTPPPLFLGFRVLAEFPPSSQELVIPSPKVSCVQIILAVLGLTCLVVGGVVSADCLPVLLRNFGISSALGI